MKLLVDEAVLDPLYSAAVYHREMKPGELEKVGLEAGELHPGELQQVGLEPGDLQSGELEAGEL